MDKELANQLKQACRWVGILIFESRQTDAR